MNFFKKLFGEKEVPEQKKAVKPVVEKQSKPVVESINAIDVNDIKKECTQIKNIKGEFEAVKYLQSIIAKNNLSFKDETALLKKAIHYMKNAKEFSQAEKIKYINDCLVKHTGTKNVNEISRIIEIKTDLSNKEALIYIESIFPSIEEIKNKPK